MDLLWMLWHAQLHGSGRERRALIYASRTTWESALRECAAHWRYLSGPHADHCTFLLFDCHPQPHDGNAAHGFVRISHCPGGCTHVQVLHVYLTSRHSKALVLTSMASNAAED